MKPLLLAVDSGNTRIKWGLHDGHTWLKQGAVAQGKKALLEQEWKSLREPSRIVISNVGGVDGQGRSVRGDFAVGSRAAVDHRC